MKNQQLGKIAEDMKGKLDANMQEAFERIVIAGMEFFYRDDSTHEMSLKYIEQAADIPTAVGEGVATIMVMLGQKSKDSMPWDAGIAAGYALVCEALDYLEQKGAVQVDSGVIDAAMQSYAENVMGLLGITDEQVSQMSAQAQAAAPDGQPQGQPTPAPADQTGLLTSAGGMA